jgi:hypothetical protein
MSGIVERPDRASRGGVQRFDDFLVREAMEKDQSILRYDRSAETLSDLLFPDDCGATRGPFGRQIVSGVDAVARGAEELWPVLREGAGGYENEYGDSQ